MEQPVSPRLLIVSLVPPAGEAVEEDEADGQDEGGCQAGPGDERKVGLRV